MLRYIKIAAISGMALTTSLYAQDSDAPSGGVYAVARIGIGIDSDLRFKAADLAPPTTFTRNADGKIGWTGEVGAGYKMENIRVEGTIGYARNNIDRKGTQKANSFDASGRISKLDVLISAYYDFATDSVITPYVGAGIGAARITSKLQRTAGLPAGGTRLNDSAWGFAYHGSAGVAFTISDTVTADFGVRHERVSSVKLDGLVGPTNTARKFNTSYNTTVAMLGLRLGF